MTNLSVSESRSLSWSQVCTSWLDHDITLQTSAAAAAAAALAAVGDVSTEALCDGATHGCDVVSLLSLPPTNTSQQSQDASLSNVLLCRTIIIVWSNFSCDSKSTHNCLIGHYTHVLSLAGGPPHICLSWWSPKVFKETSEMAKAVCIHIYCPMNCGSDRVSTVIKGKFDNPVLL